MNKTVSLDFDGVIHKYRQGYKDGSIYDDPIPGAEEYMKDCITKQHSVFIMSTRNPQQILEWCEKQFPDLKFQLIPQGTVFWNKKGVIGITNTKLAAHIYIDDRGFKFEGRFPIVDSFEPYVWKEKKICPNKDENGLCPLHNLHCAYPDCEK